MIRDGVDGYLVDASIWGSFRDKVATLIGDSTLLKNMSEQARWGVAGKTWERNNETLLGYYAKACDALASRELTFAA